MKSLRRKLYHQLEPKGWRAAGRGGISPVNSWIAFFIFLSVTAAVLESESTIYIQMVGQFYILDIIFMVVFTAEYLLRLWAEGENPAYAGPLGRLKYVLSPFAIIDILALLPFYFTVFGSHLILLRIARIFRIFVVARLGRYSLALACLGEAIRTRSHELFLILILSGIFLLLSSTAMYLAEGSIQPEHFGSIPRAFYWSAITLTTVGYGDAVPVTAPGRFIAIITAIASVAMIAMPAGVMAAAFSDAVKRHKSHLHDGD